MIHTLLACFRRNTPFSLKSVSEQDLRTEEISLERRLAETHRAIETANREIAAVVDKLAASGSHAQIPTARRQIRKLERYVAQKQRLAAQIDKALEAVSGLKVAVEGQEVVSSPLLAALSGAQRPALSRALAELSAADEEAHRNLAALAETVGAYSETEFTPERTEADTDLDERLRAVIDSRDPSLALSFLAVPEAAAATPAEALHTDLDVMGL